MKRDKMRFGKKGFIKLTRKGNLGKEKSRGRKGTYGTGKEAKKKGTKGGEAGADPAL